jgi:hypothetical protein
VVNTDVRPGVCGIDHIPCFLVSKHSGEHPFYGHSTLAGKPSIRKEMRGVPATPHARFAQGGGICDSLT